MAETLTLPIIETTPGHPVPPAAGHASGHAVTLHLPKWQSIAGFVEGKPEILAMIKNMYPRMMLHRDVVAFSGEVLKQLNVPGKGCLVFSSPLTAQACRDFAIRDIRADKRLNATDLEIRALEVGQVTIFAVLYPEDKKLSVMPYWTDAGVGISSRLAEYCFGHVDAMKEVNLDSASRSGFSETAAHQEIKDRIITLLGRALKTELDRPPVKNDDIFLYQTGMSTIYHVHRCLSSWRKGSTILFGFAFHSTPHSLEEYSTSYKFFGLGTEYQELEKYLEEEKAHGRPVQSLFAEFPANPLLVTPDLDRLRELADHHGFVLIIDDTISSFCNVDVLGKNGADVQITSLTKSFSGYADAMGGSAVLNPAAKYYSELKSAFQQNHTDELFHLDAEVLSENSRNYLARSTVLNTTAASLVDFLKPYVSDPKSPVSTAYYPTVLSTLPYYQARLRANTPDFTPGYGCLFSIEFRSLETTRAFYDELGQHMHIGPHLGAHITLAFAYNKAVYYRELDRIAEWSVNERQIRFSVGLEDVEMLKRVLANALEVAKRALSDEQK